MSKINKFPDIIHIHLIDRLALINGFVSGFALFPQVMKVIFRHSATDISLLSVLLIFLNSIVWVIYAFHRGLISIGLSALLNIVATSILALAYFVY